MANELDRINLDNLSIDKVREMKNAAIQRLKAAGEVPLLQTSHQNGSHGTHTNHSTHSNSGGGGGGPVEEHRD